jgi:hypothetical protein
MRPVRRLGPVERFKQRNGVSDSGVGTRRVASPRTIADAETFPRLKNGRSPAVNQHAAAASQPVTRPAVLWGIVVGLLQAATPLVFWWLDSATVYALGLAVIAAVYVGFAVADGRPKVIAAETTVTFGFVLVAAAAVTGSPWLLVVGLAGHGLKDLWQHRSHFVANTRWWPPFCMVVDWVVAAIIVAEIAAGMHFR